MSDEAKTSVSLLLRYCLYYVRLSRPLTSVELRALLPLVSLFQKCALSSLVLLLSLVGDENALVLSLIPHPGEFLRSRTEISSRALHRQSSEGVCNRNRRMEQLNNRKLDKATAEGKKFRELNDFASKHVYIQRSKDNLSN